MSDLKPCPVCGELKPIDEFYRKRNGKMGVQTYCRHCSNQKKLDWISRNAHKNWASLTIKDHRRKGVEVSITLERLTELAKQTVYCPLCGIEIAFGLKKSKRVEINSPSLDRTNRSEPMMENNIMILCHACNSGKSVGSLDEYIARCKRIAKKYGDD